MLTVEWQGESERVISQGFLIILFLQILFYVWKNEIFVFFS